ncbi:GNAT family N-acetyltransferase [Streptomyces sp. NPDC093221]|uniref:GNAT family N-acetyltransferase n=1 Tax=Streptomyces sp. NPDC093221 TaxID=3366032 RepID=UPI003812BA50
MSSTNSMSGASTARTATTAHSAGSTSTDLDFTFRPVDPLADADLLHTWVTHPKAGFWLMGDASRYDVERAYTEIAQAPYEEAFLGLQDGRPVFLMERYDPARVELVGLYPAQPGDVGMHFLVAPCDTPVHGFTRAVIRAVMAELFADPATRRVIVEPDVRNTAVHVLNETVGFEIIERIKKPEKDAFLSICTRERFEATR